jgi:hypothetical protein
VAGLRVMDSLRPLGHLKPISYRALQAYRLDGCEEFKKGSVVAWKNAVEPQQRFFCPVNTP